MARAAAFGLGLFVAAGVLAGFEYRYRSNERDLDYVWDQPGRRYGTPPGLYGSNSDGFHERETGPRRPGVTRVLVVGDSVVWGFGLSLEQTITRVAERALGAGWEVLNNAQSGYDIEQVAATAAIRGRALAPDLIVYGAYTNDVVPTNLIYVGADRAPIWVGPNPWPLHRWSALVRRVEGARRVRGVTEDPDWTMYERGAQALRDAAGDIPVAALVLYPHVLANPDLAACSAKVGTPGWCEAQRDRGERMTTILAAAHIPTRGTLSALQRTGATAFYAARTPQDHDHPSAEGSVVFGGVLAELIRHVLATPESDRPPTIPG